VQIFLGKKYHLSNMAKKIKLNKEYKATYTKWGNEEEIYFTPAALSLEDSNIFTILPKNDTIRVVKNNTESLFSTEAYSGERYICSKYMEKISEVKRKTTA
jgi:hypothetical protein